MMHCNGKCFLYRELKKAADAEAQNNKIPEAVLKLKTIDYCVLADTFWQWNVVALVTHKTLFSSPDVAVLAGHSFVLIKPPAAIA